MKPLLNKSPNLSLLFHTDNFDRAYLLRYTGFSDLIGEAGGIFSIIVMIVQYFFDLIIPPFYSAYFMNSVFSFYSYDYDGNVNTKENYEKFNLEMKKKIDKIGSTELKDTPKNKFSDDMNKDNFKVKSAKEVNEEELNDDLSVNRLKDASKEIEEIDDNIGNKAILSVQSMINVRNKIRKKEYVTAKDFLPCLSSFKSEKINKAQEVLDQYMDISFIIRKLLEIDIIKNTAFDNNIPDIISYPEISLSDDNLDILDIA